MTLRLQGSVIRTEARIKNSSSSILYRPSKIEGGSNIKVSFAFLPFAQNVQEQPARFKKKPT